MATIELTDRELHLVRSALNSFLADFGHDESDVVHEIQRVLAKFSPVPQEKPRASA